MQDASRTALGEHLDWLSRLRWVSFAELVLNYGAVICMGLMCAVVTVLGGAAPALLSAAGHVLLVAAVLVLAPRRLAAPLLGVVLLSLLNFSVAAIAQYASLAAIAWVYLVLGLLLLPFTVVGGLRLSRRWQGVGEYHARDDYRWLLTAAPLALRWQVQYAVRELSEEPDANWEGRGLPRPPINGE